MSAPSRFVIAAQAQTCSRGVHEVQSTNPRVERVSLRQLSSFCSVSCCISIPLVQPISFYPISFRLRDGASRIAIHESPLISRIDLNPCKFVNIRGQSARGCPQMSLSGSRTKDSGQTTKACRRTDDGDMLEFEAQGARWRVEC